MSMFSNSIHFLLLLGFVSSTVALTCYENHPVTDEIIEVTSDDYTYCSLVPKNDGPGRVFGVGPEIDSVQAYDATFKSSVKNYSVLTVCLYEKYDYHFMRSIKTSEYMFRCVCNFNLCNTPTNFPQFLQKQKQHSL
ncbi:unnamed protein product [Caenorhabditis angaria]|uniref:Uncharacterized protein n=1 Tax=Caenorhabditis angaria TaxID=860376 RepID=A0A9P1IX79_9PELO|nr:unnamed protein product [Caenorhabditis angaria]